MATKVNQDASAHLGALFQALLVTFLWSTSWVLIKIGLADIPALTFAGLRYSLAFLILLPLFLRAQRATPLRSLTPGAWKRLVLLGVVYYAVTNGAQFVSIAYLPAVTANLILGFTPVVVALLSTALLAERPLPVQWMGIGIAITGLMIYFAPLQPPGGQAIGLTAAVIGMLANAGSAILGRSINRTRDLSPLLITTVSMGIGAVVLLTVGVLVEGMPTLTLSSGLIVLWLAVVNTAFAFTLWNHTLRTLSAMESSLINTTMAVQIPILAVLFLGERLSVREVIGLVIAIAGVLVVQLSRMVVSKSKAHA